MAPVLISFSDNTATPPVFVAGSFTDWEAVELPATKQDEGHFLYQKTFDLAPGTYQYKFRLGSGDWWVCDTQAPKARDAAGNENNIVSVEHEPIQSVTSNTSIHAAVTNNNYDASQNSTTQVAKSVEVPDEKPAIETSTATAHQHNVESEVVKSSEPEKPAVSTPVVETKKSTPTVDEKTVLDNSSDAQQAPEQPVEKKLNGSALPKPAAKQIDSEGASMFSTKPAEKPSQTQEAEPEKLNWFARIFLCGSSRNIMMSAIVVTVPILVAYVIKK